MPSLLEVRDLQTCFASPYGAVRAVDKVSFVLNAGETLGIVGESGCGKTVLSLSILGLIPDPPGKIVGGEILFEGCDLLSLPEAEMRKIRGRKISMIFQEPMTALNPVFKIGDQITEVIRHHKKTGNREAMDMACSILAQVGIPDARQRFHDYPHQLSGGMRQRIMIAMAMVCKPSLMLADEPTTALDVTIQAQILDLIDEMKQQYHTAIVFITHDLGVIAQSAQRVAVMYAGEIVEYADVDRLYGNPCHPYTVGLLESIPSLERMPSKESRLRTIPGAVPEMYRDLAGCRFRERCPHAMDICCHERPALTPIASGHFVQCWR